MAAEWTDELKNEVVDLYIDNMTVLENDGNKSVGVIDQIRGELADRGQVFTVNSIRMMLMKQKRPTETDPEGKVYIPKPTGAQASTGTSASKGSTARVSKADAQATLRAAIASINPELVDEDFIGKATGKAAQYFAGIIIAAQGE